jgi:antitoxin component of MazEF toxin-antitoxin module
MKLKISRIGNSRGIRLPAEMLARYGFSDVVIVEPGENAITLRAEKSKKLSWKETAAAMARERNQWSDLETAIGHGLDAL